MIKFIYTHNDLMSNKQVLKIVYTTESVSFGDIIEDFKSFLLAAGYHPDTVKGYFNIEEEE